MVTKPFTPAFRRTVDLLTRLHLVPLVEAAIRDCRFPEVFEVTFRNYQADRPPDGWFHPSTHPTMDERQLYYYLAEPDRWIREPFEYGSRMAVMMGTATHDLMAAALTEIGVLSPPKGTCVACGRPHGRDAGQCGEWGVIDPVLRRRGHLDGLLTLPTWGEGIYDLKTCSPMVIKGIQDHDLAAFKARWPGYYGQQQEYMALSGKRQALVLFLGLSQGWPMKEFTIPRDEEYIVALEAKYRAVRNYVDAGQVPPVACCPGGARARRCPATACPIKRGTP
ncbi:hypothetical protein [Kitasatospora viridis]|uniref:PD-(D/E)XK endonuclease-like domain-containing protein n=1 Tax=Kitasatospora viridis TaxID=281105 RepID=A0A561SA77_9ACTN|nr:hypothetical protein [Kitasatospora viridis]TWF71783.1 hypothetical protein FHX73_18154 [Kitasatospora viridis]